MTTLYERAVQLIQEFQADLGKVFVVTMGLPAAGKSWWLQRDAGKYLPGFPAGSVTTSNSDQQVIARQHGIADEHFAWLVKNADRPEAIEDFRGMTRYVDNDGETVTHPITWEWWTASHRGSGDLWSAYYRDYYATRFDIRPVAREDEKALFGDKLGGSGRFFVWDTVAADAGKVLARLQAAKDAGFVCTVIYLEIDPVLCVERDEFRKKAQGRGVGSSIIYQYAARMERAFAAYQAEGKKADGVVDRLLHFAWTGTADPRHGRYQLVSDQRFHIRRSIDQMNAQTAELVGAG